jgi:hypothetical protein
LKILLWKTVFAMSAFLGRGLLFVAVFGLQAFAYGQDIFRDAMNVQFFEGFNRPNTNWPEPFGAEELYDGDDAPRIPEPMVFDLVRPLGARRGEAEINTLAVIPLNRNRGRAEWAPEVEVALTDGFAVEFELPFEEWTLESYKLALQLTFGTAFENRYIHGTQLILEYFRDTDNLTPTLLYVAGVQFDDYWSALAMAGFRTEFGGLDRANRTEKLVNFSLFRHVGDYTSLGMETNIASTLGGRTEFRLMPQVHHEIRNHIMLQFGFGSLFTPEETIPEFATRLIYSF